MSAKDDSFKLMRKDTHLLHKFELYSPTLVSDLLLFTGGTKYLNEKYFAFYTHLSNEQWAVLAVNLFGAGADVNNIELKQMQEELDLRRYSWPQFLAAVSAPKVASTPKSGAEPVDAEAARRVVWPSMLAELYGLVSHQFSPFCEGLIRRHDDRTSLIPRVHQLKEHVCLLG
jgi:hypothetical protein